MKIPVLFMITMATLAANVSARLYCRCSNIPLVSQRTQACCKTKGTRGTFNDDTGICEVNTSSGKAEEDFIGCCTEGFIGIHGTCKVDKWKGGEENKGPSDIAGVVFEKYEELTSSPKSPLAMV